MFESVDLTPLRTSQDVDMMMRRLWLAVALGAILGFGMSILPSPTSSPDGLKMPLTPVVTQARFQAVYTPVPSQLQLLLLGLAAGIVVAVPVFLIAKRRS